MIKKREYKVIETKMKSTFGFSRLDADGLEEILNEYGKEGWIFDKHISGETLFAEKDIVMLIFYREI